MSDTPVLEKRAVLFAEECDCGTLREENTDSVLHRSIPLGELMIVADGVGGYTGGATASKIAVDQLYAYLAAVPDYFPAEAAIREAATRANAEILATSRSSDALSVRLGSTVVVALVQQVADGPHAWIAHVGDSRAYLVRAGRLHRLTTDHSAVQSLLNRNLISPEEAKNHPDTAVLTRSLGQLPEVEIDIEKHPLAIGDTLLLCTDGLWGFVPDKAIEKAAAGPTLDAAAHDLLELALAAGGHDNISIEMARLVVPPEPPIKSDHSFLFKAVLGVFLIIVAAFCVLTYLTFWY